MISLYFINFREERKRGYVASKEKKVTSFNSEGNLIKVDFDGLVEEVENRFNGYSLIPRERQLFYRLFPLSSLIVPLRQTHRHSRFRRFLHGCQVGHCRQGGATLYHACLYTASKTKTVLVLLDYFTYVRLPLRRSERNSRSHSLGDLRVPILICTRVKTSP